MLPHVVMRHDAGLTIMQAALPGASTCALCLCEVPTHAPSSPSRMHAYIHSSSPVCVEDACKDAEQEGNASLSQHRRIV